MAFNIFEIGSRSGRPVCLYDFTWGNTKWRYTSADRDVTWGAELIDGELKPITWKKLAISDDGFSQGSQAQEFTVTMPRATPLADLFLSTPPSLPVSLICRRFHFDDPDQDAKVYWSGTVGNVRGKDQITVEVLGTAISATMKRTGLRLCWERNCPHVLYDENCRADKDAHKVETTITALTGTSITVASLGAFASADFRGGFVEWAANADGTIERRGIETTNGNVFALFGTTVRMTQGMAVTIYKGCDLTPGTCFNRFNNLPNHGGIPFLAGESPFDGNPVF